MLFPASTKYLMQTDGEGRESAATCSQSTEARFRLVLLVAQPEEMNLYRALQQCGLSAACPKSLSTQLPFLSRTCVRKPEARVSMSA